MRLLRLKVEKLHDYNKVRSIRTNLLNLRGIHYVRITRDLGHVLIEYLEAVLSPKSIMEHLTDSGFKVNLY